MLVILRNICAKFIIGMLTITLNIQKEQLLQELYFPIIPTKNIFGLKLLVMACH